MLRLVSGGAGSCVLAASVWRICVKKAWLSPDVKVAVGLVVDLCDCMW